MPLKISLSSLLCLALILQLLLVSPVLSACQVDYSHVPPRQTCVDDGLVIGVVILIILAPIFFIIGIGILVCFCCGICCFRGRREQRKGQIYAAPQVNTIQMPYPQYQSSEVIVNANYHPLQGSAAYPATPYSPGVSENRNLPPEVNVNANYQPQPGPTAYPASPYSPGASQNKNLPSEPQQY